MILTPDSSSYHTGIAQFPESTSNIFTDKPTANMYPMDTSERNVYDGGNVDISSTSLQREPSLNLGNKNGGGGMRIV